MDLRLTSDGKVESRTYLKLLECKLTNGERIALFSDVLALVAGKRIISAELKTDAVAVPA